MMSVVCLLVGLRWLLLVVVCLCWRLCVVCCLSSYVCHALFVVRCSLCRFAVCFGVLSIVC